MGFKYEWEPVDLILDISNFEVDRSIYSKINKKGFKLQKVSASDYSDINKFEEKYFPTWGGYFKEIIKFE